MKAITGRVALKLLGIVITTQSQSDLNKVLDEATFYQMAQSVAYRKDY
jgi:hypothetical protein